MRIIIKQICFILLILISVGNVGSYTLTINGTDNIQDAYVALTNPNTNYGGATNFRVSTHTSEPINSYIRVNTSSIPAGANVTSVLFFMNIYTAGGSNSVHVGQSRNGNFSEDNTTWNNQSCGDCGAWLYYSDLFPAGWKQYEVVGFYNDSITDGLDNFVIAIIGDRGWDAGISYMNSSEASSNQPYVNVTYLMRPNVSSWENNQTNNNSLTLTVSPNTNITFNTSIDQNLTSCSWTGATQMNCSSNSFAYQLYESVGTYYANFTGSNINGTVQSTINWTINVVSSDTNNPAECSVGTGGAIYNSSLDIINITGTNNTLCSVFRDINNSEYFNYFNSNNTFIAYKPLYIINKDALDEIIEGSTFTSANSNDTLYINNSLLNLSTNVHIFNTARLLIDNSTIQSINTSAQGSIRNFGCRYNTDQICLSGTMTKSYIFNVTNSTLKNLGNPNAEVGDYNYSNLYGIRAYSTDNNPDNSYLNHVKSVYLYNNTFSNVEWIQIYEGNMSNNIIEDMDSTNGVDIAWGKYNNNIMRNSLATHPFQTWGGRMSVENNIFDNMSGWEIMRNKEGEYGSTFKNNTIQDSKGYYAIFETSGQRTEWTLWENNRIINFTDNYGGQGYGIAINPNCNDGNRSNRNVRVNFKNNRIENTVLSSIYFFDNCYFLSEAGHIGKYISLENNTLINGTYGLQIDGTDYFEQDPYINIINNNISAMRTADIRFGVLAGLIPSRFINQNYSSLSIASGNGTFLSHYYSSIQVLDSLSSPLSEATITITNLNNSNYPAITVNASLNISENLTSIVTDSNGYTPLPNQSNSVVLLGFNKNSSTQTNYSYQICASKSGYFTNCTTITSDSSWHRPNPNTYQNTTQITLETDPGNATTDGYYYSYDNSTSWNYTTNTSVFLEGFSAHGWVYLSVIAHNNSFNANATAVNTSVQIPNNLPVLATIGNKSAILGQYLNITVSATDADGVSNSTQIPASITITDSVDVKDTYISSASVNTNFNGGTSLNIGNDNPGAVRVDMYGFINFTSLGLNSTDIITNATLQLYQRPLSSSVPLTINIHRVMGNWTDSTLTFANQPANDSYNWSSKYIPDATEGYYDWNVTNLTQSWVNGTYPNYGIWVGATDYNVSDKYFGKSEGTSSQDPRLIIEYTYNSSTSGDIITYGTNATKGTLNPTTGIFSWLTDEMGTFVWNFNATDNYGGEDNETITVTVSGNAPNITQYWNSINGYNQSAVTINASESVIFNTTANQTLTSVRYRVQLVGDGGYVTEQNTSDTLFTRSFPSFGVWNIEQTGYNSNGTTQSIVVQVNVDYNKSGLLNVYYESGVSPIRETNSTYYSKASPGTYSSGSIIQTTNNITGNIKNHFESNSTTGEGVYIQNHKNNILIYLSSTFYSTSTTMTARDIQSYITLNNTDTISASFNTNGADIANVQNNYLMYSYYAPNVTNYCNDFNGCNQTAITLTEPATINLNISVDKTISSVNWSINGVEQQNTSSLTFSKLINEAGNYNVTAIAYAVDTSSSIIYTNITSNINTDPEQFWWIS